MKKKNVSLILNLLIIILEIVGLIVTVNVNKKISFEYYTEYSNILLLISYFLFLIFTLIKKEVPKWVYMFKYATTICVTVTFLVVIFVLAPMYNFNYGWLLFHNSLLYQHLLCPVFAIVTFLFFDEIKYLKKHTIFAGISLSILYTIIIIILNILKVVKGPYPFLYVYEQPKYMSIVWFILMQLLILCIAAILKKLQMKVNKVSNN